jgi:hypothetical protein
MRHRCVIHVCISAIGAFVIIACGSEPRDTATAYRAAPLLDVVEEVRYCTDEQLPECQLDASAFANPAPGGGVIIGLGGGPVTRFDSAGRPIATYGRPGGGPGEYRFVASAHVESDGRVVLQDVARSRRLVFAADGTPLLTHNDPRAVDMREFALDRRGFAMLSDPPANPGDSVRSEVQLLRDTLPPHIVAYVPLTRMRSAAGLAPPSAYFEDAPRWAIESDSTALVASGPSLLVRRHFRDGRILPVVRAPDLGNRPVTADDLERERARRRPKSPRPPEMEAMISRAEADAEARAPTHHPFASRLRTLEDDTFALREFELSGDSVRWTLFDQGGTVLGQLRLPQGAEIVTGRRDRLLLVTTDERGVPVVGWYRVKGHRSSGQ